MIDRPGIRLEPLWIPQNRGADVHAGYHGVSFVNRTTGWAVGSGGSIVATTDGQTWTIQQPAGPLGSLIDVSFVNGSIGWAVGACGLILATTDGGATWHPQNVTDPLMHDDLWGVSFVNGSTGWVVGQHTILATTDGGAAWKHQADLSHLGPLPPDPLFSLHDVCFINGQLGWAVGDEGVIVHTSDGGQSWVRQDSHVSLQDFFNLFGVFFVNGSIGWAVGGGGTLAHPIGKILHTADGGQTWTFQNLPPGIPTLSACCFLNSTLGWVVGDGDTILATIDGGASWHAEPIASPVPGNHIYDVSCDGWAVGYGGTILQRVYREVIFE